MKVLPDQEQLIGEVLGLDAAEAAQVVRTLADRDWLRHGIVAAGAAMAARWGVELTAALHGMAEGRRLGAEFSEYELRVAREEATDDVEDVWSSGGVDAPSQLRERLLATYSRERGMELVGIDEVERSAVYVELPTAP